MQVPESYQTERQGIGAVARIFNDQLGWLFREQPTGDVGIDAHVEILVSRQATGRLLGLQIKSGESYMREVRGDAYVYRGDLRHLSYWLSHSLPVVLVLYDPNEDQAYWQAVTADLVTQHERGWSILVPFEQVLGATSERLLSDLAEGDRFELWMRRLQVERRWMELLRQGDRILLVVDEWVNKSSGRGDFKLMAQSPNGEERVERTWPFLLFPGVPYEELLPQLFDWADVSIDESFYEMYDEDRWKEETGIWDSEERRYILMDPYEDWLREQPSGLRPFEEGDEISRWRLELTLNEVGDAFLTLNDHFSDQAE